MKHGKAIYQPDGRAGEYSTWACNLYNGCNNACDYCYNDQGVMAGTLGGTVVKLKAMLVNEDTAYEIFKHELDRWRDLIVNEGKLHFNFVSDPCLPQTIVLNWKCIDYALSKGVQVQVLTKRADWLNHYAVQNALCNGQGLLTVGFTLTGQDIHEPYASPNAERIEAMKCLHSQGISTWASIEPIIDPTSSYNMILETVGHCDYYKIGIMSGRKSYTPQQIRDLVAAVNSLGLQNVYWKQSLNDFIK